MRSKEVEEAIVKLDIEKDVLRNSIDKANYDEEYREEIDLEDFKELKQAIDKVIEYIEELEKDNTELRKYYATRKEVEDLKDTINCLHESSKEYINKDKIRDKIKELKEKVHKTLDVNGITRAYQMLIDKDFEELLGE